MRSPEKIAAAGALAGGRVLTGRAGELGAVRTKSGPTDFVTEADIAAGVAAVNEIARLDPDAVFVVEEPEVYAATGHAMGALDSDRVWVIDPLDGTTSYMHGFPCYSVSVALLEGGEPAAGCVYSVASNELFCALRGQGATLGGLPITVTDAESLEHALVITGFPYDRGETLDRQLSIFSRVLRDGVQGIRRDGSAAVDLTHVACGRADAFWELALQPWDTSAGALLVTEAGGVVTALDGGPWRPERAFDVLAAGPRMHELLLELIARVEGGTL
ncbi:MAG: inositol monophosphatase [Coriobacteriales bacterium]|nr:inositol monophosphatase [Coriobacteriales bacterium]